MPADDGAVDVEVPGRRYRLSGDKHFGSGTGVCSYMITTAVPDGEDEASAFFLDTRALTTDDHLDGFTVVGEWDGIGMAATQSHAVRLDGCPAIRLEYPGPFAELLFGAAPVNLAVFTGVVLGIVDEAMADASARLAPRSADLRAYEQVEWSRASAEHWLMEQAFEGMLRAIEAGDRTEALARRAARQGVGGRAGRVGARARRPHGRRRHVLASLPLRRLVRGRPRPRLPPSALGPRLRRHLRHVLLTRPRLAKLARRRSMPEPRR